MSRLHNLADTRSFAAMQLKQYERRIQYQATTTIIIQNINALYLKALSYTTYVLAASLFTYVRKTYVLAKVPATLFHIKTSKIH